MTSVSRILIKYYYNITYPHARMPGTIDLSKTIKKTDEEYFPYIKPYKYKDFPELNNEKIS